MRTLSNVVMGFAAAAVFGGATIGAQSQPPAADRAAGLAHIAAAKKAAGYEVSELFDHTCARLMVGAALPFGRIYPPPTRGDVTQWGHEPVKVFDNLYYLGEKVLHGASPSAWAVTTSAGIILIDTMFEDSMQALIVGGLPKLNLDPTNIKYIVISHGHGDHVNGAKYLQDTYKSRVIIGAPDWANVESPNFRGAKPTRDIEGVDGQKVTLGDTTITLYLTPGHTAGTLSMLIPVKDGTRSHTAALWGGTGMQFSAVEYNKSAVRFRDIVTAAGADVLLSTHPQLDKSDIKLPMLAKRQPGDPHPWVVGNEVVKNYMTVAAECSAAAVALPVEYQGYLGRGGGAGRGGRGAEPGGRGTTPAGGAAAPAGRGQ